MLHFHCSNKLKSSIPLNQSNDSALIIDDEINYTEYSNAKPSLTLATMLADSLNKNILLNFHADWCLPCKEMEKNVLSTPLVQDLINQYIYWVINGETSQGANIRTLYDVYAYPCYLIINSKGEMLQRLDGTTTAENFADILKQNLKVD